MRVNRLVCSSTSNKKTNLAVCSISVLAFASVRNEVQAKCSDHPFTAVGTVDTVPLCCLELSHSIRELQAWTILRIKPDGSRLDLRWDQDIFSSQSSKPAPGCDNDHPPPSSV